MRARERPEFLVAQLGAAADRVLVRVFVEIVFRNLYAAQRVAIDVLLGCLARVVRRVECDVHEKRPLIFLGGADVADRVVRDDFAPVLATLPKAVELHVVRAPRIRFVGEWSVIALWCLVRHAAANMSSDLKRLVGGSLDVPFAGEKSLVPRAAHDLRPEIVEFLFTGGLLFVGRFFTATQSLRRRLRPPNVPPGYEHVSAGHADRAAPRAHVVRAGELRATARESVEVRRVDVGQSKRADRLEALVIGEEEQHVRLGFNLRLVKRKTHGGDRCQAAYNLNYYLLHKLSFCVISRGHAS